MISLIQEYKSGDDNDIYILIALIGVIVGMLIIIIFNAINENVKEKQYLREYKESIEECLKDNSTTDKHVKKKESK